MNFKKLGSVLAKRKMLTLFQTGGDQWIGDDYSMYELSGMPEFTIDTLLFTFGVNMEKKDNWVTTETVFPYDCNLYEDTGTDIQVVIDNNYVIWRGTPIALLHVADKCLVLPERYLTPIYSDQMQLYLRAMPGTGETKIIAKEGLFITAIFQPISAPDEMVNWISEINKQIIQ